MKFNILGWESNAIINKLVIMQIGLYLLLIPHKQDANFLYTLMCEIKMSAY